MEGKPKTYDLRGRKIAVVMAGNPYTESGDKFQIPDMLANRADTYNLGDIIGSHESAFKGSYLENALTSNPVLLPLANKSQSDVQTFIRVAESGNRNGAEFEAEYAAEEVSDILNVLGKLVTIRDVILMVNQEYIRSAGQQDAYRTEPAFKLQGSYRNMNRLAEKTMPIMNDEEVRRLILDHYEAETQTLTSDAEANLLKFKEITGWNSEDETTRWNEIKNVFQRNQLMGQGDPSDPVGRVVSQLGLFSDGLREIKGALDRGAEQQTQASPVFDFAPIVSPLNRLVAAVGEELPKAVALLKTQGEATPVGTQLSALRQDLSWMRVLLEGFEKRSGKAQKESETGNIEEDVDLSGISITRKTLEQIYQLIENDERHQEFVHQKSKSASS